MLTAINTKMKKMKLVTERTTVEIRRHAHGVLSIKNFQLLLLL